MSHLLLERDPVTAAKDECKDVRRLDRILRSRGINFATMKVSGPDSDEIRLPPSVFSLLQQVVYLLAQDRAVSIADFGKDLTTQQAADLCNVSRPYLIRLLEKGEIPYTKTGTHRRIKFEDLIAYKKKHDAERRQALIELMRISEEMGLYDADGEA